MTWSLVLAAYARRRVHLSHPPLEIALHRPNQTPEWNGIGSGVNAEEVAIAVLQAQRQRRRVGEMCGAPNATAGCYM